MPVRDGEEGGLVGGILAPGALLGLRVQLKLVEQDVAHLLGGGNVQVRFAHHLADMGFARDHFLAEALGEVVQLLEIHLHAGALHLRKLLGERLFHLVVQLLAVGEFLPDLPAQQDQCGRLAGADVLGGLGRLVEQRARPGLRRGLLQFDIEVASREDVHGVALLRVNEVVHQRDVVPAAFQRDARIGEEVRLQFEVVAVFVDGSVLQDGPDGVQPVPGDGAGQQRAGQERAQGRGKAQGVRQQHHAEADAKGGQQQGLVVHKPLRLS